MRRVMTIVILCMLVGPAGTPIRADSPHYLKANASINTTDACYEVQIKEAGLGNSGSGPSSVSYDLSCTASFTAACVTKNGKNFVQGQPKSGSSSGSSLTTLQVRNGSTSGTLTLCPSAFTLPDPGCTGSQTLYITAASYSSCTLDDGLGNAGAGLLSLADKGASGLFIKVD